MENIKMERYSEYKDSGVEWIGEVPEHWEVKKFKRVFYEIKKRSNSELNCGSISFGKVIYKDDEKIPESTKRSYQVVLKGDFLVNPLNLNYDLISLRIALSEIDVVVSSGYIVLSNSVKIDKSYYKYFLHRFDVAFMKLLGSGVRQTLNYNDIANCDLILPPLPEQTCIAHFLDQKIAQIDQAIAQKERLIELLKERRLVYINQILTKGLDSKCSFKDSKIDGLGQIPSHWESISLKYLLQERTERSMNGEEPLFMVSQTHGLVVRADYHEKAMVAQSNIGSKRVYKNDLVFNKLKAHLGVFFKSNIEHVGIVSPDYAVYYPIGGIADLKFLELLFRHPAFISQFICKATGIVEGLIRLYTGDLFSIKVPVPPIYEQTQILERIETGILKIDLAVISKQAEIEKLKEYKATLINSAVTGKIKIG